MLNPYLTKNRYTCTDNNWWVEAGVNTRDTVSFLRAERHPDAAHMYIWLENVWEAPRCRLDNTDSDIMFKYAVIEDKMYEHFKVELSHFGDNVTMDEVETFFKNRYRSGVDYIYCANYSDKPGGIVRIYINDPYAFMAELEALNHIPIDTKALLELLKQDKNTEWEMIL